MPPTNTLQLIDGPGGSPGPSILGFAPAPSPVLTRRPADRVELCDFDSGEELASIRVAANRRKLDSETALALVLERFLLLDEMREAGLDNPSIILDHHSSIEATVSIELWDANSAYLRHLLGLVSTDTIERPLASPRAAIPVRLADRLDTRTFRSGENPDAQLSAAVAWEIAAVVSGQTMSEWAYKTVATEILARSS